METGHIIRLVRITREYVRHNPDTYFVFGDNMRGEGFGGQAKEMRGEHNAIGVPTKFAPDISSTSYFTNNDFKGEVRHAIIEALNLIESKLLQGHNVVIPEDGLGTGLAELPKRAPVIHFFIEGQIKEWERTFGTSGVTREKVRESRPSIKRLSSRTP